MYYVYVIKSKVDDRLYKGMTKRLGERIKEHNSGKTKSTKGYMPWELVYKEILNTRKEARQREKFLKSGKGRDFLKQILAS
ncbi:GIY-YIG nuclease family protein [Winogradskyella immobilis]|uniref:GIY-YIG nuclease family protein n=1 Tax=Winogradskyella immobilis TaxID=2816852 RepID=A0ABS8EJC4_9FLAO|nr:GIY-YIG nuclease family protein [Winogradskyella immobilis]MCC1483210.1 GIY-YIG nuclease family protein [Winogradskyella immobilis]MCG0015305.1 GIY-YIG nuclease family protein [Winogradskyella immobilis]